MALHVDALLAHVASHDGGKSSRSPLILPRQTGGKGDGLAFGVALVVVWHVQLLIKVCAR